MHHPANQFYGAINGTGGLHIAGGQQVLGGTNGYTGVTTIDSGASLGLLGTGSISSSSKVIDNGALDLSVMSVNSSITSLAGTNSNANLFLGSHSLTLTAASDSFAGVISGSGGLALTSGTETLTGTNTYTGNDDGQWRHARRRRVDRVFHLDHGESQWRADGSGRCGRDDDRQRRHVAPRQWHAGFVAFSRGYSLL